MTHLYSMAGEQTLVGENRDTLFAPSFPVRCIVLAISWCIPFIYLGYCVYPELEYELCEAITVWCVCVFKTFHVFEK